ncbi:hypothetical protein V502_06876 [Pseudogymnoascus sp. VKM F-4520 (FW-2644)]|nr:hypothetical protein V502_06876 [Pseudogymnoascus sp. VKM F-4520 (FW-2644)]
MTNTKTKKQKHAKKAVRTKRAIIEDEDGWAHVVGGRTIKPDASKAKIKKWGFDVVTYTLEEITAKYESLKEKWEESDACKELVKLVQPYEGKSQVNNVVVMGLGSFQTRMGDFSRSSLAQLAALATIRKSLAIWNIPVIAQDPAFSPLDNEFLQSLGFEVLQSPEGFDLINENSLVYAIHCYPIVYDQVGKKGPPAVLIGNDLTRLIDGPIDFKKGFPDILTCYESLDSLFPLPQSRGDFSDTIWPRKFVRGIEPPRNKLLAVGSHQQLGFAGGDALVVNIGCTTIPDAALCCSIWPPRVRNTTLGLPPTTSTDGSMASTIHIQNF